MALSRGPERNCPRTAPSIPQTTASITAVCSASETAESFPSPIYLAISTLAPTASPADKVTRRATISPLVSTAARAFAFPKCPTTEVSAALKSCWSILLSATGRAKNMILPVSGPWSISMDLFLFIFITTFVFIWENSLSCKNIHHNIK